MNSKYFINLCEYWVIALIIVLIEQFLRSVYGNKSMPKISRRFALKYYKQNYRRPTMADFVWRWKFIGFRRLIASLSCIIYSLKKMLNTDQLLEVKSIKFPFHTYKKLFTFCNIYGGSKSISRERSSNFLYINRLVSCYSIVRHTQFKIVNISEFSLFNILKQFWPYIFERNLLLYYAIAWFTSK